MPQPTRRRGASPIPPPPPAELRRHYVTERRSLDDLAACYHVSAWTVKRWLRNAGIHRQPAMWATRGHRRGPARAVCRAGADHRRDRRPRARQPEHRSGTRSSTTRSPGALPPFFSPLEVVEPGRLYMEARWSIPPARRPLPGQLHHHPPPAGRSRDPAATSGRPRPPAPCGRESRRGCRPRRLSVAGRPAASRPGSTGW